MEFYTYGTLKIVVLLSYYYLYRKKLHAVYPVLYKTTLQNSKN